MELSRCALEDLAEKYRELLRLRTTMLDADPEAVRSAMRHLSRRFPGCLRELHSLPLAVLEARKDVVDRMVAGGVGEAWVEWMVAYHGRLRALLAENAERRWRRETPAAAVGVGSRRGYGGEEPSGARLSVEVGCWVEERFSLRPGSLLRTLFPRVPGEGLRGT